MSPLTFLAVEDDDVDIISIQRAFNELNLVNPLERAVDGIEAIGKLVDASGKPLRDELTIILLDLNMPRMNGFEFLEKLRALKTTLNYKVFILTTSDSDRDIIQAHEYEISGYLLKADLVESLREALQGLNQNWALMA